MKLFGPAEWKNKTCNDVTMPLKGRVTVTHILLCKQSTTDKIMHASTFRGHSLIT